MIALTLGLLTAFAAPQADSTIELIERDGDQYCNVQAKDVQVHVLMAKLGRELEREVVGFEDVESSPRINVFLRERPIEQAVSYILGSAGLSSKISARRITVGGELPPFPAKEDALRAAEVAFMTTLRRFPNSEDAPLARLELAEIAIDQGRTATAVDHYELLIESYPDHASVQDARMLAGELLVDLAEWTQALPHFEAIANIKLDDKSPAELLPVVAIARRELARCILMRGEPRRAQFMLQGLEHSLPPEDDRDRAERWLLQSRALIELGQSDQALLFLDRAMRLGQGIVSEFEGMDLRARCMDLSGKPVEASLAWLHWSRTQEIDNKRKALVRAAELALTVEGEELAVIFLHKYATDEGCGDALDPYYNEARSRLGLEAVSFENSTPSTRLDRGEQLVVSGSEVQAANLFKILRRDFWTLPAEDRLRYGLAYAPLLEDESVDAALEFLREVVRTLESVENRSRLYLLAAEICERHGRFDEAADAYGGKL